MNFKYWIIILAVPVLIWTGLSNSALSMAKPPLRVAHIIFSGLALGELKPCGCAKEEEQGGFERRMTFIKNARDRLEDVLLVDVGDNFKEPTEQGKLKAKFLANALSRMQYDAVALGDNDLVYGNDFIRDLKNIPWLASNIEFTSGKALPKFLIKKMGDGVKVALLAVGDPGLYHLTGHSNLKMNDPAAAVKERLKALSETEETEKPDLVVVLSHMKREDGLKLLDLEGVDVVINGNIETENDEIDVKPVRKNGRIFVQPGPKGQKLGELKATLSAGGKTVYELKMVPMDSSVQFDPEMVKLYEVYNDEVEELFLASLSARREKAGARVYATDKACKTCHAEAHEIWSRSQHARAYATLRKANKAFDPECLQCHTVAFNQPGGFISENDTEELENVQCETCHGSGLQHIKSPRPGFGANARGACKRCHFGDHSPRFNFEDYWSRIQH